MPKDGLTQASRRQVLLGTASAMVWPSMAWAQASPSQNPPEVADLSTLMSPAKDQGSRYTCAAFAMNAILEAAIKRDLGRTVVLSEEFAVYLAWLGKTPGPNETMDIWKLLDSATDVGSVLETDWPYRPELPAACVAAQPGTRGPRAASRAINSCRGAAPPANVMAKAAQLKVSEVFTPMRTESLVKDLMARLGLGRRAVIMAAKDLPDRDEWHQSGELRLTGRVQAMAKRDVLENAPNHFVALTGYDLSKRQFYFKNSWGPSWGRDGYGWISFDDISSELVVSDSFIMASYRGQPSQSHLG